MCIRDSRETVCVVEIVEEGYHDIVRVGASGGQQGLGPDADLGLDGVERVDDVGDELDACLLYTSSPTATASTA